MEITGLSNEHSSSAVEHVEQKVVYLKMFLFSEISEFEHKTFGTIVKLAF